MTRNPKPAALFAQVQADDLDAALAAGLMEYRPAPDDTLCVPGHPELPQTLLQTQARLRAAWQARERYRDRAVRLARRQAERDARRPPPPPPDGKVVLPSAAAAILARAKARAAGGQP
ncbi:hypothetical protein RZA67_10800 [Stenotrophomonas sp. C3(2023)]|uniref:hypothetical protein n=1 Tax=Stenotrophomonas sp. C3(2023) TaxID=3080277 RepID=UPI00293CF7D8|nr:hypothetical protein [Stenotrophomonas sp. C3(2023)]MDV3469209.1 hypothetical protein [Stenotrophomonas sp. C3(2023)]